ncbi:decarboxylating 6-phosphogluconate dehydrogenase [Candidatus Woesearchaeota archaeon]|nr:MAG: 6-phosphogluconate dehydrogenase [archaeon GW2011_AR18]MBS3161684.1 decarboxylating 6-phosphogluconate dehydrogenase [Candidatus Woesearchaeota archaeon]HIH25694.1 decarboxylating 6-phosphogluconate dehydrogenase [Nanoarchaeota archaeon]
MNIGFIGLGRMGYNMVINLLDHNHKVVVYNRSPDPTLKIQKFGAVPSYNIYELISKLPKKKVIWIMVTSSAVDKIIHDLIPFLNKGDIIIDGGNSYFKDSINRFNKLKKLGVHFVDVGVSGGIEGARNGACLMVGGEKKIYESLKPIFRSLSAKDGFSYVGNTGSGHFVKMIHNGIEYGMMASIAEGFETLYKNQKYFNLNLKDISKVYSNGSIIESRLMSWLNNALSEDSALKSIKGIVPEGETEFEMSNLTKLSYMPILERAIIERVNSRKKENFRSKIIAVLRNKFGGHKLKD